MVAPCREDDPQAAIAEAEYLLRRWCIVASARGGIRVRPAGDVVTVEEVAALLALFGPMCDETYPRVVLLDLERVKVIGEEWTTLASLIAAFAETVGLGCRVISGRNQPLAAACLFRHPHV